MQSIKVISIFAIVLSFVCLIIGFLIPVPSPFEEVIETRKPSVNIPIQKVLIDLNGDGEADWYQLTPIDIWSSDDSM